MILAPVRSSFALHGLDGAVTKNWKAVLGKGVLLQKDKENGRRSIVKQLELNPSLRRATTLHVYAVSDPDGA